MELEEEVGTSFLHLIAGAVAGTVEHCGMYPIDTIKVNWNPNFEENSFCLFLNTQPSQKIF
jgi:hypothetical protein